MNETTCQVEGCTRAVHARGWCAAHYKRWRRTGNPGTTLIGQQMNPAFVVGGEDSPTWSGDQPSYLAVHRRLRQERGDACEYTCRLCGNPAAEWAYAYSDPDELLEERPGNPPLRYSRHKGHYDPLCRSCHRVHDRLFRGRGFELGSELSEDEAQALRPDEYLES